MNITTVWKEGRYPSFNVELASKEGAEPFISIRGCKIVDGQKGQFVSYPSRKQDDGKYWNHVWASEKFNAAVLEKALASMPRTSKPQKRHEEDFEDSVPF